MQIIQPEKKPITTPICDFVENYIQKNPVRLHMPGHKGQSFTGAEERDITEIDGADVLYHAKGVIAESEKTAATIFDSGKTFYSCEGSSHCIRSMLYLAMLSYKETFGVLASVKKAGRKPLVLAARNVHKSFISAAALLDFDIEWIEVDNQKEATDSLGITTCKISEKGLCDRLRQLREEHIVPMAVYLTSPDYLGNIADIHSISEICHSFGVPLLVDNAHGAYLNFFATSMHPIVRGADMCCDSAHKTLPVLTGGAYLHLSKHVYFGVNENAERAMAMFASTSPSYLILQSLDRANVVIGSEKYRKRLISFALKVINIKSKLEEIGFESVGKEPMKITLRTKPYGYTGIEIKDYLAQKNIICEFADKDYIVFMFSPFLETDTPDRLFDALQGLKRREKITITPPPILPKKRALSVRESLFSATEIVSVSESIGRIYADDNAACPPAVPIVVCGEEIDENAVELLRYYGETTCRVVAK